MEFLRFLSRGNKEEQEARKKLEESRHQARQLLKCLEVDLKREGDRSVISYSDENQFTLRYSLEPVYPAYPEKFNSKGLRIVVWDSGLQVIRFTQPAVFEGGVATDWVNVEDTKEYRLVQNAPAMIAKEFGVEQPTDAPKELSLEEKAKLGMKLAKPCPDGRYNRDYAQIR